MYSVLISKPSISNRQARIGGGEGVAMVPGEN